jgi:hypothetical protein
VSRNRVERRLSDIGTRVRELRDEARVGEEQLEQVVAEADEARMRALVSETPLAEHEFREAQRHADAMARQQAAVLSELAALEARQDDLLDKLAALSHQS